MNALSKSRIEVDAIRLVQKGITMYVGKMKAKEMLNIFRIDEFKEKDLDGYQRQRFEERSEQVREYIEKCPLAIMPALLVSIRDSPKFKPVNKNSDFGILEFSHLDGSIFVVDGQHRLGGFQRALETNGTLGLRKVDNDLLNELSDYELPVVFIDSNKTAALVQKQVNNHKTQLDAADIERTVFFIVNKTAKSINPSLKDVLQYKIAKAGIRGIPMIDNNEWRSSATEISVELNESDKNSSPLSNLLNIGGSRGLKRAVKLNSFVSSLERLFQDQKFKEIGIKRQLLFIKEYWHTVRSILPGAFSDPSRNNYMVLKTIGVYSLNWLARDVYLWCLEKNIEPNSKNIEKFVLPLKNFEWSKDRSPLNAFGGLKGVAVAHMLLMNHLGVHGIVEAKEIAKHYTYIQQYAEAAQP